MYGDLLVIAAHPDDEVLGAGGLMARHAAAGQKVQVAFLADGVGSRHNADIGIEELARRRAACDAACAILGAEVLEYGSFPDNAMDRVSVLDVTQSVEALIAAHKPRTVVTHHIGDVNVDHQMLHKAVVTACRPQTGHPVRQVMFFEVPSSTEWQVPGSAPAFAPNWFCDITETLPAKLAAMRAYAEELRDWPHPRSQAGIEALARWRGATVGVEAAEAFILGRYLD
ncbi:PIG-L deacetylase family protein [Anianabacter salinae]|uniref:PIG-L deacetylase family protein n=1 Tax=Anianabacter salinae TaxID=2851023 RepID=UPI00225E5666|nr:PIG-L deacetylase family protein [Anianabacter salinae]MBV0914158.1 PIG-L family deacetylase [Anianabacter salinae]